MKNTKFTKGKWELKDFTIRNPNRNADKGNIFDIAQCWMGFNQTATREEAQANALLISKAPEMLEMLRKAKTALSRIKGSMMAHPDCTHESEFDDYTSSAQEAEEQIEQLIKEATEL